MDDNEKSDKENDDEFNIDFSKIKQFFKKIKESFANDEEDKIRSIEAEADNTREDIDKKLKKDENEIKKLRSEKKRVEEIIDNLEVKEETAKEADFLTKKVENEITKDKQELKKIKKEEIGENEDDLSIDFSKIKSWFKGLKETKNESAKTKNDDEIDIDIKQTLKTSCEFIKKYQVIILILIPIIFSIFFRMYPAFLPITDDWATQSVYSNVKASIRSQIDQQYPNLPDANKNALVDTNFEKIVSENKDQIDAQIKATSDYFKSKMEDGNGQKYLSDIDTYLWYGEVKNYIKYGQFGDSIKDGKDWYSLRNGRDGREVESIHSSGSLIVHQYFEVLIYKIMHILNKEVNVMAACFYVSVIVVALSIIPAFFIGRKLGGNIAGFFAGMIVALNQSLLERTPAGVSDTDPWNIFFPLFISWMFIEAIEAESTKKRLIFSCAGGLMVGVFSRAWLGWWYPLIFIFASLGFILLYYLIREFISNKKISFTYLKSISIKNTIIIGICFFFSSAISVIILNDLNLFISALTGPLQFMRIKSVGLYSLWPNVMTTVAEFNIVPLKTIINQMGGKIFFLIAIIGIISTILIKNKAGKRDILYASFLILWFIGTAYSFTKGVRFAILMVPAFAIAFGIAISVIYKYLGAWLSKTININKSIINIVIIILALLLFIQPMITANAVAKQQIPLISDEWYDSLIGIKNNSTDAIITSWWDFGHWFVAIAERKVTFDGADQGERIHWVGKSLLTSDEDVSMGILRMLNCGQEKAPHTLESYLDNDTVKVIDLLNKIIVQDKRTAYETLKKEGLKENEIQDVLKLTHCDDLIPSYYITSEDMIGKAGVWGHFGAWDFKKAEMYNKAKKMASLEGIEFLKTNYNLSNEEANKIYYEIQSTDGDHWISPWPGYMGGPYSASVEKNIVSCSNGIKVDLSNYTVQIPTQQGMMNPNSLVYATKDDLKEKIFDKNIVGVSLALIPDGKSYTCLLVDPLLAKSMFTRLFFFDGHGSEHFKIFSDKTTFRGERIQVWKVDWQPGEKTIMNELQEKINVKEGDEVSLYYTGWTKEDGIFDSSIPNWKEVSITQDSDFDEYKSNSLNFVVGSGKVIPGFENGVLGMKINSTKIIEIPPEQAYGTDPSAHPLGNKTLFFKIKLIDIS
jgi:dolichyl-diphosphooligosaccharide--protein glycosyltransferase